MSTWIIAKPRIKSMDAIDLLFKQLPNYLESAPAFFMDSKYYHQKHEATNDALMSEMMTNDDFDNTKLKENFFSVWKAATTRSEFSPLLSNRLLCPVVPRAFDKDSDAFPRRRIRNRTEKLIQQLETNFKDFKVLLLLPDLDEYEVQIRAYFLLTDGYGDETATRFASITRQMVEFCVAKLREMCGDRVVTSRIATKAGPLEMMHDLYEAGIPFIGDIMTNRLAPVTNADYYMLEASTMRPENIRSDERRVPNA